MAKKSVGIIGGGLCGLSTGYYLKNANIDITIIEARDRLGGRIHTHYSEKEAPVELGATWLGKKHKHLVHLLSELHLGIYEQYMGKCAVYDPISTSPPQVVQMPYNPDPTYRIKGGSSALINQLIAKLDQVSIHKNTKITEIKINGEKIVAYTEGQTFEFDILVMTLPPKLFLDTIKIEPSLPAELVNIGSNTQTWMSESIKVALTYPHPFWKDHNPIGSIFSNTGLISEMYDHSNCEESKFALKGFINGGFAFSTLEERKKRVIAQLTKYFGNQVENYTSYHETIWRDEVFTHSDYEGFILPHQNNGHEIYQQEVFDGRLLIGGSETASQYPGYMDGAVESAKMMASKIKKALA